MTVELYKHLRMRPFAVKRGPAELARQAEETGWYGGFLSDSQHFSPETWVSLGQAIEGSSTLSLAVGVTNPATRDVSVTASAAAAAYFYSGGRFVLGLGRGDSSVHKIGRKPVALEEFELRVTQIQEYLSGGTPGRDTDGSPVGLWAADVEMAKPPMDLAATGPKVIAIGARHAERAMALLLGDLPWVEQVKLDSPHHADDARLAGLAGREVAGLLGFPGAGPAGAAADEESGHQDLEQERGEG